MQDNIPKISNDNIISEKSRRILNKILIENPQVKEILISSESIDEVLKKFKKLADNYLSKNPVARKFCYNEDKGRKAMERLDWQDYAAIRIVDYVSNAGRIYKDLNLRGKKIPNNPFAMLWEAAKFGTGKAKTGFFLDMLYLFRQFYGRVSHDIPTKESIIKWMDKYPVGTDPRIVEVRNSNIDRITSVIIKKIDSGEMHSPHYTFADGISREEKAKIIKNWWNDYQFHLDFAIRKPDILNEMLDNSLDEETLDILYKAEKRGIPFFINPYYLSLLNVDTPKVARGADLAIRYYVFYSKQLVEEFGHIVAWEKEDLVEPGKPNAAGWILPTKHNIHRRYPEVAILIPDTMGRACGGLCASCQRMYDFQRGNLNFNLEKLRPSEKWGEKLTRIMKYWENDSKLRDILVTGGDALMSADKTLKNIFNEIYKMALAKKEANEQRKEGEKYAEILRVRLGSRLPAYLPQRITPELTKILKDFKEKASKIGIKQFVLQTHFQSPLEITPEAKLGIQMIISAGWTVTNQLVFTAPSSRRGHTAKLRKALNDIGVLTYYTFSVKGYRENSYKFATNARAVQEQIEEKVIGSVPNEYDSEIRKFPQNAENLVENINNLRDKLNVPFLATDRNVMNLPGVGKSLTFRVIGITRGGRRILEFDHDFTRSHSPVVEKIGKFVIIESKSIYNYLQQLEEMGEDRKDYESIWGYSIGETEPRHPVYEYPQYDFKLTEKFTNIST
ncbi:MAG: KamA family protein [Bacteroidetes bacterium]|nr:KamA family protein [Bacteroidota bacterium]